MTQDLEKLCVNTIRAISADQPEAANSGHPGAPMGCAPMAHILWAETMKFSPKDPAWINRDRFVLSNGHACALQYSMLHLLGYNLSLDDLKNFRKLGSKTPGHPENFHTEGVEVCTGPLGQGLSQAVGMAIAEAHLAANFNKDGFDVIDHHTFVICGDGCMQEGITAEACSLAGHLGLGKLIVLYDDNNITIDGDTELSFTEDVLKRYEAYGWHTQTVTDVVDSLQDLRKAVENAKKETSKPSIIKIKTAIGYGSPSKQGLESAHGAPLGAEDLAGAKKFYGLPSDQMFYVPDEVREFYNKITLDNENKRAAWEQLFAKYAGAYPDEATELSRRFANKLPEGILDKLPVYEFGKHKAMATRKYSQECLAAIGPDMKELVGGSADLTPSNLTFFKEMADFQKNTPEGRYLRFGVREHAMVAIANGLFAHGGVRPYCATFMVFISYCVGAIRLSALSRFGVLFVMTHDSIGLGEDGPTHQPIETLESLRSMPNILVIRPADGNETAGAYHVALQRTETPTVICCSRQNLESLELSSIANTAKGAYTALPEANPDIIIVATGSEVGPSLHAAKKLAGEGIKTRVVSMPCQELFLEQPASYQREILPGNVPTLAVEAASPHGWHRFSHAQICMDSFGASGEGAALFEKFGFTPDNIAAKGKLMVDFYKKAGTVPDLNLRPVFDVVSNGH